MTRPASAPVVVGVDGSEASRTAVTWAASEAALRRRPLRIVHAFVWPLLGVPLGPSPSGPQDAGLRNEANGFVDDAVAYARSLEPDVDASGEVLVGMATPTLVAESKLADLVVVGHRGLGGFSGLLVGSVGVGTAAHAHCPVVVVRRRDRGQDAAIGHVVVGVDGSPESELAIAFAFEEASRRGLGLTAVHAWTAPTSVAPGEMLPLIYDVDLIDQEETRLLAELLAGWREKYPDVHVQQHVTHARATRTLVEESETAELVVVGSRGRGGIRGLLLGSVSQTLVYHASCPVAIVREHRVVHTSG